MIDRDYNLRIAADVRELLAVSDQRINLMLALVYRVNKIYSEAGYVSSSAKVQKLSPEMKAHMALEFGRLKAQRILTASKLQQLCKIYGLTMHRTMGGRVASIRKRLVNRRTARPTGSIVNFNQQGLFIFSDLFTDEALDGIVINEMMFADEV